jgi:predicted O-methyltransferase YrrM
LNEVNFEEFIGKLEIKMPSEKEFQELGDVTALFRDKNENFVRLNYERGMLLYALIAKYRPKNILEIGTASGYATLCMAWAMEDHNIDGKIFTIDPKSHQEVITRKLKIDEEIKTMSLSRRELWKKFVSSEWIKKIEVLTGYSYDVLDKENFPKIEFCYVDGSHVYTAVKQDFFRILKIISQNFHILFDDYVPNENGGVTKFIDEEISNVFETIFIKTNTKKQRIVSKTNKNDELVMCLIDSYSLKKSLWEVFDKKYVDSFLNKNKFLQKRIKIRHKINKKIPFLNKIKFQWWKKE